MSSERPNILYIHSHDTGRYIQPYGHAIATPHLQQLAEQGVLFRQAFSAAPTCSPSRASLLTGQSAHSAGMLGLAHRGFALHDYRQHMLHTLRKSGYTSTLIGMQHIARDAQQIGYDEVLLTGNHNAPEIAERATNFLKSAPTGPFFLDVGFFETHREYPELASEQEANYTLPPPTLPDTPQTRYDMARYKTSARILDAGIGAILNALEEAGLAENTLVISTTDHGIAFPGMKGTLTDHGIGVSLIMRGPGGFSGGKVCDALISHIDIFPTLCDLLGIERPEWLQGRSLLPLMKNEAEQIHEAIFAESTYHAAYEPQRAVRTQRWKYIKRFEQRNTPVLPNGDDAPSKNLLLQYGLGDRLVASEALYDLIFDPQEAHNVADDPAYSDVLQAMQQQLNAWMQQTNDPLLKGAVQAPPGAILNDPNQASPNDPTFQV